MNSWHQSGFRRNDSTETLLLRLLSDFYNTLAHGQVTLLALLDVTSVFDSVDNPVLVVPSHLSWLGVLILAASVSSRTLQSYALHSVLWNDWYPVACRGGVPVGATAPGIQHCIVSIHFYSTSNSENQPEGLCAF